MRVKTEYSIAFVVFVAVGCVRANVDDDAPLTAAIVDLNNVPILNERPNLVDYSEERAPCDQRSANRIPLFGDLHVHTGLSFDAAARQTHTTPEDAHRFARGEDIPFWPLDTKGDPLGSLAIDRPLDFLAVTDHAEFLGEQSLCETRGSPRYDTTSCVRYRTSNSVAMGMLARFMIAEPPKRSVELCGKNGSFCREWSTGPWQRVVDAAEAAYDRSSACTFTSFVAYEYTGTPGRSNYHRNVIFRNGSVPARPVSYLDAPIDDRLWAELDTACETEAGCDYLTIPHNSNLSNGRMAPYLGTDQSPAGRRAYAQTREAREPIMEIFQHKGNSECVNGLATVIGAPDELCNVEQVRPVGKTKVYANAQRQADGTLRVVQVTEELRECDPGETDNLGLVGAGCVDKTDFLRSGLLEGLLEEAELGANPFKLGIVAATDTHASTPGAVSEKDWRGHVTGEMTPRERLNKGVLTSNIDGNPGGLAGVWAVENSRDAIFDAMMRREVFGTTGPRITPRFFAGWNYSANMCGTPDAAEQGYAGGVPMGGDLKDPPVEGRATFLAYALRDPDAGKLSRLQLVKGWIDRDGVGRFDVIDIATADREGEGQDSLCTVFRDENFDPDRPAYYYLRVVERPTPRWHMYDCARLPENEKPALCTDGSYPEVTHEMAWSSPIWYRP